MLDDRQDRMSPDDLAQLHAALSHRLRAVCADMPPDRFDALVREVARVKLKYDRPTPERL